MGVIQRQHVSDEKKRLSRELRKNMTPAEKVLWEVLRNKGCHNLKFRRQQVIEGYIVDFFCASKKLVIEVDGSVHDNDEQKEYDKHRREEILGDDRQLRGHSHGMRCLLPVWLLRLI